MANRAWVFLGAMHTHGAYFSPAAARFVCLPLRNGRDHGAGFTSARLLPGSSGAPTEVEQSKVHALVPGARRVLPLSRAWSTAVRGGYALG